MTGYRFTGPFESAHRWRPWDSDVFLVGAEASVADDPDESRDLAGQALRRTPDSYEGLVTLAVAEIALGDDRAAMRHLGRAASLFPQRRLPPMR
jgi:hypothetical protein